MIRNKIIILILLLSNSLLAQNNKYLMAKIEAEQNNYVTAKKLIEEYRQTDYKPAIFLKAKINIELKQYKQALELLNKLKLHYDSEILLLKARANAGLGKDEPAISQLDKYLSSNKKLAEPIIESFAEFQHLKTSDKWKSLWKNDRYSKKENLLNNVLYAIKSNRYAEANDRLDEILIRYKTNAQAHYLKAKLLFIAQKYKEAYKHADKAVANKSKNIQYQLAKAKCLTKMGRSKKALALFNHILQTDSLYLDAYLGRAEAYMNNKEADKAEDDILKYRAYYPNDKSAQLLNAQINTVGGNFLEAISNYGKLISHDQSRPSYFIGRADAYLKTNTYKYAIYDYAMALDLDPGNVYIYKQKAMAHKLAGEMQKACTEWKQAAKLGDVESMSNLKKYCK